MESEGIVVNLPNRQKKTRRFVPKDAECWYCHAPIRRKVVKGKPACEECARSVERKAQFLAIRLREEAGVMEQTGLPVVNDVSVEGNLDELLERALLSLAAEEAVAVAHCDALIAEAALARQAVADVRQRILAVRAALSGKPAPVLEEPEEPPVYSDDRDIDEIPF